MITKAIVESQVDKYHYKVRIPIFDRAGTALNYTQVQDLCVANISTPKGINNNIQIGDVVFVGFEDNDSSQPIILGHLYRDALIKDNNSSLNILNLTVNDSVTLPVKTSIGDISYSQLQQLINEISDLKLRMENLNAKLQELQNK